MTDISSYSVESLGDFLTENGIPHDFVSAFEGKSEFPELCVTCHLVLPSTISSDSDNQIDGETFLELTEADVKEMVKPIGIVKKIMKVQREVNSPYFVCGLRVFIYTPLY